MSSLATEILDVMTDRHAGTDLNGSRVGQAAHLAVNWLFVAGETPSFRRRAAWPAGYESFRASGRAVPGVLQAGAIARTRMVSRP